MVKRNPTTGNAPVLRWMQSHGGQVHHIRDVATALGCSTEQEVQATGKTLATLARKPQTGIEWVASGAYLYRTPVRQPAPEPKQDTTGLHVGDVVEVIGFRKESGVPILRSADGTLYETSEL